MLSKHRKGNATAGGAHPGGASAPATPSQASLSRARRQINVFIVIFTGFMLVFLATSLSDSTFNLFGAPLMSASEYRSSPDEKRIREQTARYHAQKLRTFDAEKRKKGEDESEIVVPLIHHEGEASITAVEANPMKGSVSDPESLRVGGHTDDRNLLKAKRHAAEAASQQQQQQHQKVVSQSGGAAGGGDEGDDDSSKRDHVGESSSLVEKGEANEALSSYKPAYAIPKGVVKVVDGQGKGFEAKLDLFPDFGFDKRITEVVRVNNFRDGVYYNVPASRSALEKIREKGGSDEAKAGSSSRGGAVAGLVGGSEEEKKAYFSHYVEHGLPFKGDSFLTSNDWRGKCFYEAHNFCVLNGTMTFFHRKSENPNIIGGSLRMCTEFSQHSPTIRLKYESRPIPDGEDGRSFILPAPLLTKTPAMIVQYWCQDLFHMTLTMLPAYQTVRKEFPKLLASAGILKRKEGGGDSLSSGSSSSSSWIASYVQASGGGHDGNGPIPSWWTAPRSHIASNMSVHYPIDDGEDIVHPDVYVRIAKGKRKKSAYCRVKLGDPRNWEDVRNSKWGDKQFPIAGNPYWPFYQTLTSQPDRIYPLYRGATAKSACYTNGIVDKYYIKNMMGEEARQYTGALVKALNISQSNARRRCGHYRLTLIDRRGRTRRLTNIPEIAEAGAKKGFIVQPVALETLPIRSQLELIASTDVLMGMHGNGITWLQFLPPGSAVVELVGVWYTPYALLWGHKHFHSSMKNNKPYKEGGEFKPFAHNVTEIEAILDRVRAHLDSTSCGPDGKSDLAAIGDGFKPPNERLENLYKDCVPHC